MKESVETSVALHHSVSELVVVFGDGLFEVEQRDDRLRPTCRFDLRMDGFEFAGIAPDQNHVRAITCASERNSAPDTAARTCDGDDAARELIRSGDVILQFERIQSVIPSR